MTEFDDLHLLDPLLDEAHMERLVQGAMVRVRAPRTVSTEIARLWPGALAAAAASVLLVMTTSPDAPQIMERAPGDQSVAMAPVADVNDFLMAHAAAGTAVTMADAFTLLRPEGL